MTSHHRNKSSFLNTTHRLYPHKKRVQKGRKKNNLKTSYCFNHYCYHCCSGLDAPLFKHERINLLNIDTSQPTFLLFCSLLPFGSAHTELDYFYNFLCIASNVIFKQLPYPQQVLSSHQSNQRRIQLEALKSSSSILK